MSRFFKSSNMKALASIGSFLTLGGGLFYYLDFFDLKEKIYTEVAYDLEKSVNANPADLRVTVLKEDFVEFSETLYKFDELFVKLNNDFLAARSKRINDSIFSLDLTKDPNFSRVVQPDINYLQFSFKRPDKYFSRNLEVKFAGTNARSKKARDNSSVSYKVTKAKEESSRGGKLKDILQNLSSNATVKIYRSHVLDAIVKGFEFKKMVDDYDFEVVHHYELNGKITELTVNEK